MGMLTLAGVVSGGGKALQRGLENTQQYMSQSLLLEERDKNERDRLKLTFGHDEGMLQKRLAGERANNIENAALQHKNTLERDEQRQDFEAGENRKTRQADREKEDAQAQRQAELEEKRQQNAVTNKILDVSYEQQKDATKSKADLAKEARERAEKRRERQEDTGKDIVLETLRGQRPHAGSSASNAEASNRLRVITDEIHGIEHRMASEFDSREKAKLQQQLDVLKAERRSLAGMTSTQRERPGIRWPE